MANVTEAIAWAKAAEAGEYLAKYADDDQDEVSDSGSRCGFSDETLGEAERLLGRRGLKLTANDRGLVAEVV